MISDTMKILFRQLDEQLDGYIVADDLHRILYSTDASVYKETPLAVAFPKNSSDIKQLLKFASNHGLSLIPRTAGTSLAGQCVGYGIVVDTSRYMNQVLEIDVEKKEVWVEPGVIRDELNDYLRPFGLFFGPNTSTSNRCMIGGMVGNNSSGTTSIQYGTTRDHVVRLECILSDGSTMITEDLTSLKFKEKCHLPNLEGEIYRKLYELLSSPRIQQEIREQYPKPSIHRRNHGYAIDVLSDTDVFSPGKPNFNLGKLIAGSEGTLAFITRICLSLDPLPPPHAVLLCIHFHDLLESLRATQEVMKFSPSLCELMDKIILDCTKGNLKYEPMREFVIGDPATLLMVEFRDNTQEDAMHAAESVTALLQQKKLGYAYPILQGVEAANAFALRKAGLGLLSNVPGDAKPVACIEDTAVALEDLPDYIEAFGKIIAAHNQRAVYYAHAGAGELHLRPILNLKTQEGVEEFRKITYETAQLVKSYGGTLSGEHGDGRVRAEFLPLGIGDTLYEVCKHIKHTFDPKNILNPGKIIDAPPMDTSLRYEVEEADIELDTGFHYGEEGFMRMIERCNGSGDCRQLHTSGAVMCPSYMATKDEKDTTRARANALREFIKNSTDLSAFSGEELKEVMDLCISCKGCSAECPSNVDMAMLKSEYLYQRHRRLGVPLRDILFSNFYRLNKPLSKIPKLGNAILKLSSPVLKKTMGIAEERDIPMFSRQSASTWLSKYRQPLDKNSPSVVLFIDEFIDLHEVEIVQNTVQVLNHYGYYVNYVPHKESGRAAISKGDLSYAKKLANTNVKTFGPIIDQDQKLVGIEPSAILTFRDEYPKLVDDSIVPMAQALAKNALTIEEFLYEELPNLSISNESITRNKVVLHGHCHQKALSNVGYTAEVLEILGGYQVEVLPTGCCGMAGSFGYEREHYHISLKIGELVLFPAIRTTPDDVLLCAPGSSCRHQITDGTKREAIHPIILLHRSIFGEDHPTN